MHTMIEFPNLGIYLENVGKAVTVFNFDIALIPAQNALEYCCNLFGQNETAFKTGLELVDNVLY